MRALVACFAHQFFQHGNVVDARRGGNARGFIRGVQGQVREQGSIIEPGNGGFATYAIGTVLGHIGQCLLVAGQVDQAQAIFQ